VAIVSLLSWITCLLLKVRSLEIELAGRRRWHQRSQRDKSSSL
jgi:hypothetical protein